MSSLRFDMFCIQKGFSDHYGCAEKLFELLNTFPAQVPLTSLINTLFLPTELTSTGCFLFFFTGISVSEIFKPAPTTLPQVTVFHSQSMYFSLSHVWCVHELKLFIKVLCNKLLPHTWVTGEQVFTFTETCERIRVEELNNNNMLSWPESVVFTSAEPCEPRVPRIQRSITHCFSTKIHSQQSFKEI